MLACPCGRARPRPEGVVSSPTGHLRVSTRAAALTTLICHGQGSSSSSARQAARERSPGDARSVRSSARVRDPAAQAARINGAELPTGGPDIGITNAEISACPARSISAMP